MAVEQGTAAGVGSRNGDSNGDDDDDDITGTTAAAAETTAKSHARKPLPQVKTVVSRAFRWYRSNSVDNLPQLNAASAPAATHKPAVQPKPKTTADNKGTLQWLNWGDPRGSPLPTSDLRSPTSDDRPPPLILDPPHFTRRFLGYCACLNAPFDLFQLLNHRAPHAKRRNYRCLHGTRIV